MIHKDTRILVVADSTDRYDPEVLGGNVIVDDAHAHAIAQRNAQSEPGRKFFVVQIVGHYEAVILPPQFTPLACKLLPRHEPAAERSMIE